MQSAEHSSSIDYRVEKWPAWAQREFGLQFWSSYAFRLLFMSLQGKPEAASHSGDWAEDLYQRTYQRIRKHTQTFQIPVKSE